MYRSFELSSEIIEARWKFPVSVTWNVSLASPDNGETWFQGFKSLKRFNDIQERDERGGVRIFGKLIFLTTNPTNSTVVSPHKDRWPFMEACARLWHFKYPPNGTRVAFPLAELPWTWFDRSFVVARKILSSVDSYTGQPSYYDFDDHFLGKIWKFHILTLDEERYLTRPLVSVLTWYIKKNSSYPRIHPICKYFRVKRWSTNVSILIRDQLPAIDSFQECWIYITNNVYQDRYSVSLNFHWYNTRFHSSARYYFPYEYTRFNGKDLTS